MDTPVRIDIVERHDSLLVVVEGELDIVSSPLLDEALERAGATAATDIVVDLRAVSFIDSTGLHVLVKHARPDDTGPPVRLTKGSPRVQRLFELSGALEYLPFVSD